jgi:hypothetical protein
MKKARSARKQASVPHESTSRKGFTPSTWDELDDDLSGDAFQLLIRIRRVADRDETDGSISARQMKALAALHDIGPAQMKKAVAVLIKSGRLRKERDGFLDVGFANVCRSSAEREARRERWKDYSRSYRQAASALESPETLQRVSASPSPSRSPSPSDGQPLTRQGRAAKAAGTKRGEPRGVGEPPDEDDR